MPLVASDGTLCAPLMVVLQEREGKFGPQVSANMFSHPLLYVTASGSGKHLFCYNYKKVNPSVKITFNHNQKYLRPLSF